MSQITRSRFEHTGDINKFAPIAVACTQLFTASKLKPMDLVNWKWAEFSLQWITKDMQGKLKIKYFILLIIRWVKSAVLHKAKG